MTASDSHDSPASNVFHAAGKTMAWQPLVRNPVLLEPVAEDVRPDMQQVAHFAMLCVAMRAGGRD